MADIDPPSTPIYNNMGAHMDKELQTLIIQCLTEHNVDAAVKVKLATSIIACISGPSKLADMKARLAILFEYEKNYLQLVKEFKEEIKFAGSIQEDLRKERAKFFSDTLKEVSATLKESQVDSGIAAVWLKDLVGSYTKSLDLSSGLIEEQAIDMIGKIRDDARSVAMEVEANTKP
jgi:hypothetical protein